MSMRILSIVSLLMLVTACASTAPRPRAAAQIEIQEQVGFTITESVSVSDKVRADYESALMLLEQGHAEQGIGILESITEIAPEVSGPRIDLGIAYHRQGDFESAERQLQSALDINADHPVVHNELGIIYRKTGRFAEARRSYEAALAVYPGYHHARRNLGVLCDLYLGDLNCALASYVAYLETVPADEQASMWIADLRYRMGLQE